MNTHGLKILIEEYLKGNKYPLVSFVEHSILRTIISKLPIQVTSLFTDERFDVFNLRTTIDQYVGPLSDKMFSYLEEKGIIQVLANKENPTGYVYRVIYNRVLELYKLNNPEESSVYERVKSILKKRSEFRTVQDRSQSGGASEISFQLSKWAEARGIYSDDLNTIIEGLGFTGSVHKGIQSGESTRFELKEEDVLSLLTDLFEIAQSSMTLSQIMHVVKGKVAVLDTRFYLRDPQNEEFQSSDTTNNEGFPHEEQDKLIKDLAGLFLQGFDTKYQRLFYWYLVEYYSVTLELTAFAEEIISYLMKYRNERKKDNFDYDRVAVNSGFKSDETVRSHVERNQKGNAMFDALRAFSAENSLSEDDLKALIRKCFLLLFGTFGK